jgi:hypothetical protein
VCRVRAYVRAHGESLYTVYAFLCTIALVYTHTPHIHTYIRTYIHTYTHHTLLDTQFIVYPHPRSHSLDISASVYKYIYVGAHVYAYICI